MNLKHHLYLFISYWYFSGYKTLLSEKMKLRGIVESHVLLFPSDQQNWNILFMLLKIFPFILFIFFKFYFFEMWMNVVVVCFYAAIGLGEYCILTKCLIYQCIKVRRKLTNDNREQAANDKDKKASENSEKVFIDDLTLSMIRYATLLSSLTLFLGIGFLYLSEPWYLYSGNMILWLSLVFVVYLAGIFGIFSKRIKRLKIHNISLRFIFYPVVLILLVIYILPHVNRSMFVEDDFMWKGFTFLFVLIIFLIVIRIAIRLYFKKHTDEPNKVKAVNLRHDYSNYALDFLLVALVLLSPLLLNNIVEHENVDYFNKRVQAVEEVSNKRLLTGFIDSSKEFRDGAGNELKLFDRRNNF